MTDASKMTDGEAASAAMSGKVEEAEPTMEDRARALVAGYERGMETNSPRTMAELNEMRALLLGKG